MTCNPWRWLWGLIPVAMLSWLAVHLEHARIENDLSARAAAALSKAGMPWAAPGFAGRDGVVAGRATAETDPARAIAIVRDIWGVRIADNRVELLDFVDKFLWNAEVREKRLRLTGVVPGDDARRAVLSAAKSAFPSFAITDELRLARGPVDAKSWSTGAIFALTQLSALRKGYVELNGLALSIGGEASTRPSYDAVIKTLGGPLAAGLKLARQEITPPVISPYQWTASWSDGSLVTVGGYSPDKKTIDAIKAAVDRRYPSAQRVVAQEVGGGAPEGFAAAVLTAIDQLRALNSGSAELVGSELTFSGEAADAAVAAGIRTKLKAGVPRTIRLIDRITFPEPVAAPAPPPPPPVPDPYVISGGVDGSGFILEGYVPDQSARSAIAGAVKTRFPRLTVDDRLEIAAGAPGGWQSCVTAAVAGLMKLEDGQFSLDGTTLRISGSTSDRRIADTLAGEIQSAAGSSCKVSADIDFIAPEPPPVAVPAPDPEAERRKAEAERCETLLREAAARGVILFEYASADLDPKSTSTLNEVARIANTCPSFRIEIEGHTDSDGTPERHQKLSDRRAASVVNVLIKSGVSASRLTAVGYGATRPVADNATPEGRAMNRRIEFTVKPN